jgi:uncharacterized membrane protein SpoIIM required for sporulation
MYLTRFSKERLFSILISRMVIFFFLMCLLTLFLYAAGTVQNFIDTTQLSLLRLYSIFGIFLAVSSGFGFALDLHRFVKTKKIRYLSRAGGYMLLLIFGATTVLTVISIIAVSSGNGV